MAHFERKSAIVVHVTAVGRTTEDINKAEDAGTAHGHINSTDALQ